MSGYLKQALDFDSGLTPDPLPDRRYIFDITELVRFAHSRKRFGLSGIPRIVLLLSYYAKRARPDQVKVGYFDNVQQSYKEFPYTNLLLEFDILKETLRDANYVKPVKHWKHKRYSLKRLYHDAIHALALSAKRFRRGFSRGRTASSKPLDLRRGDCLLCLGGSWNTPELFHYLEENDFLKPGMVDLAVLVPDMIPALGGEVASLVAARQFDHWLKELSRLRATLLVNSRSTYDDVMTWYRRHACDAPKLAKFAFADELVCLSGDRIRADLYALEGRSYVLVVGPLSGRKNGGNLIRAWQMLSERVSGDSLPLLVFAGSETGDSLSQCGLSEDLADWDKLRFIRSPNDLELQHLYKNCLFTVYPSFYEGWGLPIGESLWHGKVCATSNVSSMPEAGGTRCEYFDPADPRDMAQVIERLITDPAYLNSCATRIDHRRLRTWEQASKGLLATLDNSLRVPETSVSDFVRADSTCIEARTPANTGPPADPDGSGTVIAGAA